MPYFCRMGKDKLKRFAEIETFENVFQRDCLQKGKWDQFFGNKNPITLELACGKGEYTIGMARMFPERNFIGIDVKGNRIWRGAKTASEEKMGNVAFLRITIEDILEYFEAGEVEEIWITFPDPQPTKRRLKKRLTYQRFMDCYKILLNGKGTMNLKTDNDGFYEYTLEVIEELKLPIHQQTNDLYKSDFLTEALQIKTFYEKQYLAKGKNINYVRFTFPN